MLYEPSSGGEGFTGSPLGYFLLYYSLPTTHVDHSFDPRR